MKKVLLIVLIFVTSSLFAKGPYITSADAPHYQECRYVFENYKGYVNYKKTTTPSDDERIAHENFDIIISFYRGYEMGFVDGRNIGMNSSISSEDLSLMLFTKCKQDFSKRIFFVIQEIYNFYQN